MSDQQIVMGLAVVGFLALIFAFGESKTRRSKIVVLVVAVILLMALLFFFSIPTPQ